MAPKAAGSAAWATNVRPFGEAAMAVLTGVPYVKEGHGCLYQ